MNDIHHKYVVNKGRLDKEDVQKLSYVENHFCCMKDELAERLFSHEEYTKYVELIAECYRGIEEEKARRLEKKDDPTETPEILAEVAEIRRKLAYPQARVSDKDCVESVLTGIEMNELIYEKLEN